MRIVDGASYRTPGQLRSGVSLGCEHDRTLRAASAEKRITSLTRGRCASRQGFTLIELLVVISIIALLISMLLPTLSRTRDSARMSVCLSNQKQAIIGITAYASGNDGYWPRMPPLANAKLNFYVTYGGTPAPEIVRGWVGIGLTVAYGYINNVSYLYCPSQRYEAFTYEKNWGGVNSAANNPNNNIYRRCSYYYRIFNQTAPQVTAEDVDEVLSFNMGTKKPRAMVADIFYAGYPTWGPYPMDTAWAHINPHVVNAGYSDGHAESFSESAELWRYATQGFNPYDSPNADDFVVSGWKYLDGEPERMESHWPLP
ncbi:MAG: type II secretion system protein [Phycisphaeraceae bacterium]|nr:type II secretion system protein [Phycisphaeraceae bacterium]